MKNKFKIGLLISNNNLSYNNYKLIKSLSENKKIELIILYSKFKLIPTSLICSILVIKHMKPLFNIKS